MARIFPTQWHGIIRRGSNFFVQLFLVWTLAAGAAVAAAGAVQVETLRLSAEVLSKRVETSDAVYLLRIEQVESMINVGSSEPGMLVLEGMSYSGKVIKSWKGRQQGLAGFRVFFSACAQTLNKEGEYLVFAQRAGGGQFQVNSCEDVVSSEAANPVVMALDSLLILARLDNS